MDALLIQGSIARKEMLDLAIQHRLPVLTSIRLRPSLGALMSYGPDYSRWGNRQTALTKRSIDTPSGRISYTEAVPVQWRYSSTASC